MPSPKRKNRTRPTKHRKAFSSTKPLEEIHSQIQEEIKWLRRGHEAYGELLVDPWTVALARQNPHLQQFFKKSKLNRKNTDHWKLALSVVLETVYRRGKSGRPKGKDLKGEVRFLREMVNCLHQETAIDTAKGLADALAAGSCKHMTVKSIENKISKVQLQIRQELADLEFVPRLPMPKHELQNIVGLLERRLAGGNKKWSDNLR